jgi:predicted MFS family arabinose efflux permease
MSPVSSQTPPNDRDGALASRTKTAKSVAPPRGTIWILLSVAALALVCALVGISWRAATLAEQDLRGDMAKKAEIEAQVLRDKLDHALQLGIPLGQFVGFDDLFAGMQSGDPDLKFAAIHDRDGRLLYAAGLPNAQVEAAIAARNDDAPAFIVTGRMLDPDLLAAHAKTTRMGDARNIELVIGHDRAALTRPITDNLFDIGIILVVALALSFELMLLVLTVNITLPVRVAGRVLDNVRRHKFNLLHGQSAGDEIGRFMGRINQVISITASRLGIAPKLDRETRLIGVRMLAFMFVLAEELARPIMPDYFARVSTGTIDGHLGAGVVMALHLLMVAIAMPIGSLLKGRLGPFHMYLAGAVLATAGLIGTAFTHGFYDLMFWRALSGLGYATTFVACQGYVLDATTDSNRTQGSAMMVSGIMLADICGPAIGGIIASHIDPAMTFLIGGGVAILAVLLAMILMDRKVSSDKAPPVPTRAAFRALLSNRRFVVLLAFAAVPAKLILSGFLYYLVPVYLFSNGANTAEIGRVIMLYGLVALLSSWLIARWTDAKQAETRAVGIGGGLTAIGLIGAAVFPSLASVAIAVAVLGLAQATSIPALLAASLRLSKDFVDEHGSGPVLAVMRLAERLGGALGPILAAALTVMIGTTQAFMVVGVFALIAVVCFEMLIGKVSANGEDQQ